MNATDEEIVAIADKMGEFVRPTATDFYYYRPVDFAGGLVSAYALRAIADELDRRNQALFTERFGK